MNLKINLRKPLLPLTITAVAAFAFVACAADTDSSTAPEQPTAEAAATDNQPYAGLQDRLIKAIDPDRVDDLLAGRGAGFALTAELNSYPGPTHVLKMAEVLELSNEQKQEVEGLFEVMSGDAKVLGENLVALEADLDQLFREGTIDRAALVDLTGQISNVEGQLRAVHLGTHLTMVNILSEKQIAEYDRLRGYSDAPADADVDHSNMAAHG